MTAISAVVFDLDGTPVDSAQTVESVLNAMRAERGLPKLDVARFRPWIALGAGALVANALETGGADVDEPVAEFRRRYANTVTRRDHLYESVESAVASLASMSYRLAVCTNKPERLALKVLKDVDLISYFSAVVGGDTLEWAKPDRRPLLHAIEMLQVTPEEAVLVGDSHIDEACAAAAGVQFVFFSGGYEDAAQLSGRPPAIGSLRELDALLTAAKGPIHHG